jgi:hypothetical protein
MGQRAMSAKNSAEALAAKYSDVLHRYAFSWKHSTEHFKLNDCLLLNHKLSISESMQKNDGKRMLAF